MEGAEERRNLCTVGACRLLLQAASLSAKGWFCWGLLRWGHRGWRPLGLKGWQRSDSDPFYSVKKRKVRGRLQAFPHREKAAQGKPPHF